MDAARVFLSKTWICCFYRTVSDQRCVLRRYIWKDNPQSCFDTIVVAIIILLYRIDSERIWLRLRAGLLALNNARQLVLRL
jgi:hypothetical protein